MGRLCCEAAHEHALISWMSGRDASRNMLLTREFRSQLPEGAPAIVSLFEHLIDVQVVNDRGLMNAQAIRAVCEQGHQVATVVASSKFFYFIWRLFLMLGAAALDADIGLEQWRFRFRPPGDVELEQLTIALRQYGAPGYIDQEGLGDLVTRFQKVPGATQNLLLQLYLAARLFVVLHEVGHFLPNDHVGPTPASAQANLPPRRDAAWRQEISADLNASRLLLVGIGSGLLARTEAEKQAHGNHNLTLTRKERRAIATHAFEVVAACLEGVWAAYWFADQVAYPPRPRPLSPTVDPRFATHPPIEIRYGALARWLSDWAKSSDLDLSGSMLATINTWFRHLASLKFPGSQPDNA